jgi:ribonuclease HI
MLHIPYSHHTSSITSRQRSSDSVQGSRSLLEFKAVITTLGISPFNRTSRIKRIEVWWSFDQLQIHQLFHENQATHPQKQGGKLVALLLSSMVNGGAQVKLYAPASAIRSGTAQVPCWNLPAWICAIGSPSVMKAVGNDANPAVVHPRVAEALGIKDGDSIELDLRGYSERISVRVTIKDIAADFLVHPLMGSVPAAAEIESNSERDRVKFQNGEEVDLFKQHVWAGMGVANRSGVGILMFDGASRNNPQGPAGCGFAIYASKDGSSHDGNLVMGYRFFGKGSCNEMEYQGMIEGMHWAFKLKLKTLVIEGDSELVIRQMKGEYAVEAPNLVPLHCKAQEMLNGCLAEDLKVVFRHISREKNAVSDSLANCAVDLQENMTTFNWPNVNNQCRRAPW